MTVPRYENFLNGSGQNWRASNEAESLMETRQNPEKLMVFISIEACCICLPCTVQSSIVFLFAKKVKEYFMDKKHTVWISAGEPSGDMQAALLVGEFLQRNPDFNLAGMGGDAMVRAGFKDEFHISELSLVGLSEIVVHLPRIAMLLHRIYKHLKALRPVVVIVVDAPDFNFFIARMAKRLGIPVYSFICPQVWAWRTGRVRFLKKYIRKVLCILPFEKEFLAGYGLKAEYVGNPLLDQIPFHAVAQLPEVPLQVGIVPGSRKNEISSLLPDFLDGALLLKKDCPQARFVLVRAPGMDEKRILEYIKPEHKELELRIVGPEKRYEALKQSRLLVAASGTVTLEAALLGTPCVVCYKVSPLTYTIGKCLVHTRFMSLVNHILDKEVFPELLQGEVSAPAIYQKALPWLTQEKALKHIHKELAILRDKVGEAGAAGRAVDIILADLAL